MNVPEKIAEVMTRETESRFEDRLLILVWKSTGNPVTEDPLPWHGFQYILRHARRTYGFAALWNEMAIRYA